MSPRAGSSDNLEDVHDEPKTPPTPEKQIQHRANTTMHVCWHRNTSVSMVDHNVAIEVRGLRELYLITGCFLKFTKGDFYECQALTNIRFATI